MSEIEVGLAEFALHTRWADVPPQIRKRTVDLVLDSIACAYTGRSAVGREEFADATRGLAGGGDHPVIGDDDRWSLFGSAMVNAWQVTATTMCDVYRPAMCHVTPIVLSAALAGASSSPSTIDDFLTAFAIGVEVTLRLCTAMDGTMYRGPRWHAPGIIGPFGSAATFGRLLGLDEAELRSAWGASLLHSAGTFSAIGTPGVKLTQARGAAAGVQAVAYALAGHGGSADSFVHPDGGLFDAYSGLAPELVLEGLGSSWMSLDLSLRRWPASSSLQGLIAAVLELREAAGDDPDAVLSIVLPVQSYKLCGEMPWNGQLAALQSAAWVAAAAWTDGRCWLDQFDPAGLVDPARNATARRVRVSVDASLPEGAARVAVAGSRGAMVERLTPPGSPADPLSSAEIQTKLALAAGTGLADSIRDVFDGGSSTADTHILIELIGRAG